MELSDHDYYAWIFKAAAILLEQTGCSRETCLSMAQSIYENDDGDLSPEEAVAEELTYWTDN